MFFKNLCWKHLVAPLTIKTLNLKSQGQIKQEDEAQVFKQISFFNG